VVRGFREDLAQLLKARFPVLYVESYEEQRVIAEVSAVAGDAALMRTPRMVWTWSLSEGLVPPNGAARSGTTEPAAAPPSTWPGTAGPAAFGQPPVSTLPPGMQPPTEAFYGYGPAAQPAGLAAPIDVNTATAEQFAALPGFDPHRASRTVAQRQARSGFGSLEEFAIAAGLPPHQFAPLRHGLTCSPLRYGTGDPPSGQVPQGRVVDV
jgi:hypothetical protein